MTAHPETPPARPSLELIAHRGAKRERPENTLGAFARAIELGADALELDVHATRDGVVVVHHDAVPKDVGVGGEPPLPIAQSTAQELGAFRVGGERIPTLAAVLALAEGRATVYVEIKGVGIERAVADVVRASGARCAIHSFDHEAIGRVRALAPEIPRGLLFEHRGADMLAALVEYDARDLWPHVPLVDEAVVEGAHRLGRRVVVWTVNSAADAARLAATGVDALCGDDVPLLRDALRDSRR
ncbi:MAG: glycerophosphodiester phosphodiesterase [Gemmatimonadaceae bacterium]|nr:glycerophosphodiester phosphodiesterase [Gemmatimonadaceae bacterium]